MYSAPEALHHAETFSPVVVCMLTTGRGLVGSAKAGAAENKCTLIDKFGISAEH